MPEVALAELPPNFENFSKTSIFFCPLNNLFASNAEVKPARPDPTIIRS